MSAADSLIDAAAASGATIIRAAGSTIIVIADREPVGDDLLALETAAALARCSVRTLRAAVRAGELAAYGRQRSRTVRRSDLMAWIESRRVRPVVGVDDEGMARRVARLARRTA